MTPSRCCAAMARCGAPGRSWRALVDSALHAPGHAAIELCGEAALGLHMGRLSRLAHAGLAGVTAARAPTPGEAARTLLRFEPLYAANYRATPVFRKMPKAPGSASTPSAHTTPTTDSWWIRYSPAGWPSLPTLPVHRCRPNAWISSLPRPPMPRATSPCPARPCSSRPTATSCA